MKINIFFSLLFSALMMLSLHTIAQPDGRGGRQMDPEQRAERQTNRMNETLNLNDAQYEMIYAINLEAATQMSELWQSADGDQEAMRKKMMAMRTDIDKKIQEVLNDEQLTKYNEMKEARQGRMRDGRRGQRDGQGPKPQKDGEG